MKIKSLMSKPVKTVKRKATIKEAVKIMAKKAISCVVISEKKIPIGIFTKRDLLSVVEAGMNLNKTKIEPVMHTPVLAIKESENIFTAARHMDSMEVRRFILVDRSAKLLGIITETDIVRGFALRVFSYQSSLAAVAVEGLTASPKTPLKKIVRMMLDGRRSCVTILKNRKPVGMVSESNILKLAARAKDPLKGAADDKMSKRIIISNIESSVRKSVVEMIKRDFRHIVVVDDHGRYAGTVSQRELVHHIEISQV